MFSSFIMLAIATTMYRSKRIFSNELDYKIEFNLKDALFNVSFYSTSYPTQFIPSSTILCK